MFFNPKGRLFKQPPLLLTMIESKTHPINGPWKFQKLPQFQSECAFSGFYARINNSNPILA